MKSKLFTPGPTKVPGAVLSAVGKQVLHHRTPEFSDKVRHVQDELGRLLQTLQDRDADGVMAGLRYVRGIIDGRVKRRRMSERDAAALMLQTTGTTTYDGFQDADGCPDKDNDGDGLLDADDNCPDVAEDRDGFEDEDGCPDEDNDGDGILDVDDECPDDACGDHEELLGRADRSGPDVVDAGDDTAVPGDLTTDWDGDARIIGSAAAMV